jgi:hypothetical protein
MKSHRSCEQSSQSMARREVLRLSASVAARAAVGPFVMRTVGAMAAFNWQRNP